MTEKSFQSPTLKKINDQINKNKQVNKEANSGPKWDFFFFQKETKPIKEPNKILGTIQSIIKSRWEHKEVSQVDDKFEAILY